MARVQMRGLVIDGLLLACWLGAVGLVVLHQQGKLGSGPANLARTLRATSEAQEQWFGLYYQDHKIGYAHTMLYPDDRAEVPGISVTDQGYLSFTLLGKPQQVEMVSRAFIDADWRLQDFYARLRTKDYDFTWTGVRKGESLEVTVRTGKSQFTSMLHLPDSAIVVGLSPWSAFHRLRPGQWGRVWILNPLALTPEEVYFHVRGTEVLEEQEVLVVETDFRGMTATSWITRDGDVLKEESPLGWRLVRETWADLFAAPWSTPDLDLLSTTAVPIDRTFETPGRLNRVVWLVRGVKSKTLDIERPWQRVLPAEELAQYGRDAPEEDWFLMELRRPTPPIPGGGVPRSIARYRRPSLFVQSDHESIHTLAQHIVANVSDPWEQAVALNRWVYGSLSKRLTVGLPSALDVLASQSGDCHEHTILYTALARSLGLPTRMVAGLVYYSDRLYYHAWPEVWLGAWVPTDPTLGQPLADATHLGLIEAENEQLVSLGKFIGAMAVEVLEAEQTQRR